MPRVKESTQNKNKSRVTVLIASSPAGMQRQMFRGHLISQAVTGHFGGLVGDGNSLVVDCAVLIKFKENFLLFLLSLLKQLEDL